MADIADMGAQMAQWAAQMQAQQGQGGSGSAPILLGARLECNVGSGLSLQGKGLNSDSMMNKLPQGKPGMFAKLLKDIGFTGSDIAAGMKKCAEAAPPQQPAFQQASQADLFGQGAPVGGYSANIGRGDSDFQIT
jgi:hypothetical protein